MNSDRYKIPYDIDGLVYRVDEFQYYSSLVIPVNPQVGYSL